MAAPEGGLMRDDLDACSHLDLVLAYQRHWCMHKPSVTVSVTEGEWQAVGDWVFAHFDEMAGVSFLPHDTGSYKQTPYEAVTEAAYTRLAAAMPARVDWARLQVRLLLALPLELAWKSPILTSSAKLREASKSRQRLHGNTHATWLLKHIAVCCSFGECLALLHQTGSRTPSPGHSANNVHRTSMCRRWSVVPERQLQARIVLVESIAQQLVSPPVVHKSARSIWVAGAAG